jgi:anti-sigma factor RsiW
MSNLDPLHSESLDSSSNRQIARSQETIQRDRFELLSAYMDGEVTADERRKVEDWLANDPTVQQLHARLLNLRHAFQSMPVPVTDDASVRKTVDAVLAKVDRRPRLSVIWGGIAIAAVAVGAVTTALLNGDRSPIPQIADRSTPSQAVQPSAAPDSASMLVALDKPLVSLPKTPVANPADSTQDNLPSDTGNVR